MVAHARSIIATRDGARNGDLTFPGFSVLTERFDRCWAAVVLTGTRVVIGCGGVAHRALLVGTQKMQGVVVRAWDEETAVHAAKDGFRQTKKAVAGHLLQSCSLMVVGRWNKVQGGRFAIR